MNPRGRSIGSSSPPSDTSPALIRSLPSPQPGCLATIVAQLILHNYPRGMPEQRRTQRRVTDPAVLKALAHPMRMRLYELLVIDGPANASALAEHVDEPVALVSYHLHQLGRYGYAEHAPELARDNRERWWRAVPGGVSWSAADFLDDPGARATALAAWRVNLGRRVERIQSFQEALDSWGKDWADAAISSDSPLRLTPDELRELGAEVHALLRRWRERETPDEKDEAGGAAREHVFAVFDAVPFRP